MRSARHLLWLLVLASACGGQADAAGPHTHTVALAIHHSRFTPASFTVKGGTTVRIVVRNSDPIDHELIVGDQATQDRHEHGQEAHHDGSVPGAISVPAGAVVATTYHFERAGQFLYGCHLPGHWAYGMRGEVRVSSTG